MALETIFSLCSGLAMVGWLGLVFLPKSPIARDLLPSVIIPVLLGVTYAYLMFSFRGEAPAEGGFGTLAEVKALFSVDALLLAGWIHYLAFDLFVGAWILGDSMVFSSRSWQVDYCGSLESESSLCRCAVARIHGEKGKERHVAPVLQSATAIEYTTNGVEPLARDSP